MAVAARVSALDEWVLVSAVVGDVSGGSVSGVGLVGALLLLLLLLFNLFDFLDFFDFLDVSGGAGVLLEESIEVIGISWVELSLQSSEVNGNLLNISDGELSSRRRADSLGGAANLVSWVVQSLSVLWAALESGGGLEWVQEVTERR